MVIAFPQDDPTLSIAEMLPLIDAGFLISTIPIALLSNRYWPMWACSVIVIMFLIDFAAAIFSLGATAARLPGFAWVVIIYGVIFFGTFLEGSRPTRLGRNDRPTA
jgi:uncharacterized membrane protein